MATGQNIKYQITAEDRFSRVFSQLKSDLVGSAGAMGSFGAAGGGAFLALTSVAAIAGGAGLAIKRLAADIHGLNDAAAATGDSVENISALDSLARRNGSSLQVVVRTVQQLNEHLRNGKEDSPVARALKAIGIEARELEGASATEQLQRIAKALSGYGDSTAKVRVQQTLFGANLREIAPFMKDLIEDGNLVATVTSQQAAEAERFNKELARMSAELGDVGRAAASEFLPGINNMLANLRAARQEFGGFWNTIGILPPEDLFRSASDGITLYSGTVAKLEKDIKRLRAGGSWFDNLNADRLEKDLARATAALQYFKRVYVSTAADLGQSDPTELARRGRGPRGTVDFGAADSAGGANKVSEAERLVETLRKQTAQYDKLGAAAKLAYDIQHGAIQGLTPALERELRTLAERVDEMSRGAIRDPLEGWKQEFLRSEKEAYAMLDKFAEQSQERLGYAINDPGADQRQTFLQSEKRAYDDIDAYIKSTAANAKSEFERLLETVDGFAKGTTEALLDMAEGADGSFDRLFKAFSRDVLRALIEDPVRETMKNVVKTIRDELGKLDGANNPIASLFKMLSGAGGGIGDALGSIFSGFTGRANGGSVNAGDLVRWQENGREWFIPGQSGSVVTERQMRSGGGSGGFSPTTVVNVNGDVSPATVSLVRRMLDDRDARNMRSMRYGRAA